MSEDERDTRAIGDAIREATADVTAPPGLRERLARPTSAPRRRRRRGAAALAGVAVLAVAAVLIVAGTAETPDRPDGRLAEAVALALSPARHPAPGVDPADPIHLTVRVGPVGFPSRVHRWQPTGMRTATVAGRGARMVTYRGPAGNAGYAIVDAPALAVPGDGRRATVGRLELTLLRRDDTSIVTWRRKGRTCVLASRTVGTDDLAAFAAGLPYAGAS